MHFLKPKSPWLGLITTFFGLLFALEAYAHHGWGYYDMASPVVAKVEVIAKNWSNPHPELRVKVLEGKVIDKTSLPVPDALRALGIDAVIELATPASPGSYVLDLAPIARMKRWGLPREPQMGDVIEILAFPACTEPGVLRPSLIVLDAVGVRQQSVPLPKGCSGEPRGE